MTRIRNNLKYDNIRMLESCYGISLRTLTLFAEKTYKNIGPMKAALKAISVILFKLEGQIIMRHPEYKMDIKSDRNKFETKKNRLKVRDTDIGKKILEQIYDLEELLKIYREDNLIHN